MAKIYGEIAASGLMTFDKSFARSNGQPLDSTEVFYSLVAAQDYAKTDVAYVGQKIVVVETEDDVTTVTHYGIEADGTLKELGAIPVGDGVTVEVVGGKIQLADLEGHASGTYQPFLVDGKIEWREPSATTVEGLDGRLTTAEGDIDALEGIVGKAAEGENAATGLVKDVADLKEQVGEGAVSDQIDAKITALDLGNTYETKGAAATAKEEIEAVIGEVAEGKTVAQMIADAQDAASYDDTALAGRVKAIEDDYLTSADKYDDTVLAGRVSAIENDYLKKEDKTELSDAISAAEESAVNRVLGYLAEEEVNTSYDTLKEVAAWIESDTTNSTELINRVSAIEADYLKGADKEALEGEIDALSAYIGDLPEGAASATVVAYIQEVVDGLNIGDYAKASELTTLAERVTALEGKAHEHSNKDVLDGITAEKVSAWDGAQAAAEATAAAALSAAKTELEAAIDGKVDAEEGYQLMSVDEKEKLAKIEAGAQVNKIEGVDSAQFGLDNKHLTLLDIAMGKVTGLSDALAGKVDKVEGSRLLTEDEATKLEKLVLGENGEVSVSGKVSAGNVDGLEAWITARAGTLEGLSENNLTDTLLDKLNGIAEGAQVNVIDTVSDEFTITGKNLAVNAIAQDKITGLADTLAGKVDVQDGYRLISETELERISKIESGAQVNVLEGIKVGDTLLEIVDKIATIPVGAGLKASDEVTVAEDGTLGIGEIGVGKLVNDGTTLILNGGTASV